MANNHCEFCEIIDGTKHPSWYVVSSNDDLLILMKKEGDNDRGTALTVVPVRHVNSLLDLSQRERDVFSPVVAALDTILRDEYNSKNHTIASPTHTTASHISVDLSPKDLALDPSAFDKVRI